MIITIVKNISKTDTSNFEENITFYPNFDPYPK